jgi:hypothetical protein
MLIKEVTTPSDQLHLLKTIIDNTWSAISAEAAAEKQAKQRRAATASKYRPKRSAKPAKPATKGGARGQKSPTAQKKTAPQAAPTQAEKTAAQLVLRGQNKIDAEQQVKQGVRPSYPSTTRPRK